MQSSHLEILSPKPWTSFDGGEDILFSVAVTDFEGSNYKYAWDFDDGANATGREVTHAYDTSGTYHVKIEVTNEYEEKTLTGILFCVVSSRFVKLDELGRQLRDDAHSWSMVLDQQQDIIWEVKDPPDDLTDYLNPHDPDNTYTWYDSNPDTNGGDAGTPGSGTDTEDFITQINYDAFGDRENWRMPTCDELKSIRNPDRFNPAVNTDYFPNTSPWYYWSSTTYEEKEFDYAACHIYFMGSPLRKIPFRTIKANNHYGQKFLSYHARAVADYN